MVGRKLGRRTLFTRFLSVAGESARAARLSAAQEDAVAEPATTSSAPPQVVTLQAAACIAYRGTLCSICSERCPEPGAIAVDYGRPSIIAEKCTGCGECVSHCPAPINALSLRAR